MRILIVAALIFLSSGLTALASPVYDYQDFQGLITYELSKTISPVRKVAPSAGITSHHLPTAAPLISEFYLNLKARRPEIKKFIVVGPDHFEKCRVNFSYSTEKITTSFGTLWPDQNLASDLKDLGAAEDLKCFNGEHAIGVEANFIKKLYPDASLTPILLSYAARGRDFSKLIKYLAAHPDIFVIASIDFSHYLKKDQAEMIDVMTKKKIIKKDGQGLELKNVDSPATLKLMLDLARKQGEKVEIIDHKNSADFTGNKNNTTSYFDVFFTK